MPAMLHASVKASKYYASRSDSIVIQSDGSRKQADNIEDCFKRLHQLIVHIGEVAVKGETSSQQVDKVRKLYVWLIYGFYCTSIFVDSLQTESRGWSSAAGQKDP